MLVVWRGAPTAFDNYVYLADAWKHGHNWIAFPGDFIDAMPYHGRAYIVEAPLPAILMFPAVLVYGTAANQTLLDNLLGAVAVFGAWRLCERIGLGRRAAALATAFLFFGTSLFVCATHGDVWFLGHVSGAAFSLLALSESFGRKRPWLVAVWGLAAAFSRYALFAALPFYLILLLTRERGRRIEVSFALPIIPALVAWGLYNYARFGTIVDRGYALWYWIMDPRARDDPAMFSAAYVPQQLELFFLRAPQLRANPPWIVPSLFGTNVLCTSFPFAYALFAGAGPVVLTLWGATLATALPSFLYYDTGGAQYGVRHALDFEPFLFALLALALVRRPSRIVSWLLGLCAVFGLYEGLIWLLVPQ